MASVARLFLLKEEQTGHRCHHCVASATSDSGNALLVILPALYLPMLLTEIFNSLFLKGIYDREINFNKIQHKIRYRGYKSLPDN